MAFRLNRKQLSIFPAQRQQLCVRSRFDDVSAGQIEAA
jgi:hypothetical protein